MKKLLPALLAVVGLGAGLGAGLMLRPTGDAMAAEAPAHGEATAPEDGHGAPATGHDKPEAGHGAPAPHGKTSEPEHGAVKGGDHDSGGDHGAASTDFVKLNNQFVVPVVAQGRVKALVIMALSVEVTPGSAEAIYEREPKLRDALLQVMFDHANAGGFDGVFTDGANLIVLRRALTESAQRVMGDQVRDVLISDISRQDS